MNWEELNPALFTLFTELGKRTETVRLAPAPGASEEIELGPVAEHKDRPRKLMSPVSQQALAVELLSVRGLDVAAVLEFDEGTEEQTERIVANRIATYRLRCDSLQNTDTGWAWGVLERIRTRLRRTRSYEALLALNAALLSCMPTTPANFKHDGRIVNRVLMDVQLLVCVNEYDPEPLDWIEQVVITSEYIKDADGTNLPPPLQMVDVFVPPET